MRINDIEHEVLTHVTRCHETRREIMIGDICREFGWSDHRDAREVVTKLVKQGLVERDRTTGLVTPTARGLLLLDVEASAA